MIHDRLNTFLELKVENERLQQRVTELRAQSQAIDGTSESPFVTSDNFGAPETRASFEGAMSPEMDEDGPRSSKKVSARPSFI